MIRIRVVSVPHLALIANRVPETAHISAHVIDAVLPQEMLNASVERLSNLVSGKRLSIVFELGFQRSIKHWRPRSGGHGMDRRGQRNCFGLQWKAPSDDERPGKAGAFECRAITFAADHLQ
jgi:hypothetical protein